MGKTWAKTGPWLPLCLCLCLTILCLASDLRLFLFRFLDLPCLASDRPLKKCAQNVSTNKVRKRCVLLQCLFNTLRWCQLAKTQRCRDMSPQPFPDLVFSGEGVCVRNGARLYCIASMLFGRLSGVPLLPQCGSHPLLCFSKLTSALRKNTAQPAEQTLKQYTIVGVCMLCATCYGRGMPVLFLPVQAYCAL